MATSSLLHVGTVLDMPEIEHQYTTEIVCPHCGYEFSDSWEFEDSGDAECYRCDLAFFFERQIEVTYTTVAARGDGEHDAR